jgi:hypothetical protein
MFRILIYIMRIRIQLFKWIRIHADPDPVPDPGNKLNNYLFEDKKF